MYSKSTSKSTFTSKFTPAKGKFTVLKVKITNERPKSTKFTTIQPTKPEKKLSGRQISSIYALIVMLVGDITHVR